jgi:hypothetical protein
MIRSRSVELGVASLLLFFSIGVMADSWRIGISWAEDGPRAGYFPFYIGLGLAAISLLLILRQLECWRIDRRIFADRAQLRCVWSVFWPTVVYVTLIAPIGIYGASILLMVYFMRKHGAYRWAPCLTISLAVAAVLFITFEIWFGVPLPKGPIEGWLGF